MSWSSSKGDGKVGHNDSGMYDSKWSFDKERIASFDLHLAREAYSSLFSASLGGLMILDDQGKTWLM